MASPTKDMRVLRLILLLSAAADVAWFTSSHWLWHRTFFHFLGVRGADLESSFVASQLQLIGVLVLGYALMMVLIATNPARYRAVLGVVLLTGGCAVAVFVANIAAGSISPMFAINAGLLTLQISAVIYCFPKPTAVAST